VTLRTCLNVDVALDSSDRDVDCSKVGEGGDTQFLSFTMRWEHFRAIVFPQL